MPLYDAKYKSWGDKPSADEIYQVVTYAYRLGLRTVGLQVLTARLAARET